MLVLGFLDLLSIGSSSCPGKSNNFHTNWKLDIVLIFITSANQLRTIEESLVFYSRPKIHKYKRYIKAKGDNNLQYLLGK